MPFEVAVNKPPWVIVPEPVWFVTLQVIALFVELEGNTAPVNCKVPPDNIVLTPPTELTLIVVTGIT